MRLRISIRGCVRPSVGRSVPSYFRTPNMAVFECEKSSTDIVNNGTMSDDEVVASDVPPRYLFTASSRHDHRRHYHLQWRCPLLRQKHWETERRQKGKFDYEYAKILAENEVHKKKE